MRVCGGLLEFGTFWALAHGPITNSETHNGPFINKWLCTSAIGCEAHTREEIVTKEKTKIII